MEPDDIDDRAETDVVLYGKWNLLSIGTQSCNQSDHDCESVMLYGVIGQALRLNATCHFRPGNRLFVSNLSKSGFVIGFRSANGPTLYPLQKSRRRCV